MMKVTQKLSIDFDTDIITVKVTPKHFCEFIKMFRNSPTAFDDCRKTAKVTLNLLAILPKPEK